MANIIDTEGLGTKLRKLLELLDGDLEAIYKIDGLDYRPRYTPIMKALVQRSPLTVKEIAMQAGTSHSAASQSVAKMVAAGWLQQTDGSTGRDARERPVSLTENGRKQLPSLQLRWESTQRAAESLDEELGNQLVSTLDGAIAALKCRSFKERIQDARGEDG